MQQSFLNELFTVNTNTFRSLSLRPRGHSKNLFCKSNFVFRIMFRYNNLDEIYCMVIITCYYYSERLCREIKGFTYLLGLNQ